MGTKRSLQDRVEDDVREEQNALNEDEGDADGKRSPSCLSTFEKLVVQDARLGAFPLVNAEAHHDDKSNDETGQDSGVGPREKATSQVQAGEEQGEASRKEAKSDEVKMLQLLQEGQVVESSMSLRWPVPNKDADSSQTP